jgi:hypothetical protein
MWATNAVGARIARGAAGLELRLLQHFVSGMMGRTSEVSEPSMVATFTVWIAAQRVGRAAAADSRYRPGEDAG